MHNGQLDWFGRASAALLCYAGLMAELASRRTHRHRRALELSLGVVADGAESVVEVDGRLGHEAERGRDIRRDRRTAAEGRRAS